LLFSAFPTSGLSAFPSPLPASRDMSAFRCLASGKVWQVTDLQAVTHGNLLFGFPKNLVHRETAFSGNQNPLFPSEHRILAARKHGSLLIRRFWKPEMPDPA